MKNILPFTKKNNYAIRKFSEINPKNELIYNLTKKIEPVAPHSGIAISQDLNNIIWDTNDIYLRKYVKIEFNGKRKK